MRRLPIGVSSDFLVELNFFQFVSTGDFGDGGMPAVFDWGGNPAQKFSRPVLRLLQSIFRGPFFGLSLFSSLLYSNFHGTIFDSISRH